MATKSILESPNPVNPVRYVRFFPWPGGAPPQDLDALMHFDREIIITHSLEEFVRPLCAADAPEGEMVGLAPVSIDELRDFHFRGVASCNAVHVVGLEPGIRIPCGMRVLRSFDFTSEGWVVVCDDDDEEE